MNTIRIDFGGMVCSTVNSGAKEISHPRLTIVVEGLLIAPGAYFMVKAWKGFSSGNIKEALVDTIIGVSALSISVYELWNAWQAPSDTVTIYCRQWSINQQNQ